MKIDVNDFNVAGICIISDCYHCKHLSTEECNQEICTSCPQYVEIKKDFNKLCAVCKKETARHNIKTIFITGYFCSICKPDLSEYKQFMHKKLTN